MNGNGADRFKVLFEDTVSSIDAARATKTDGVVVTRF